MLPTLAHVCTLNASLERDIEDYAAGKCPAMELWWGKVEAFLEQNELVVLQSLLEQNSMQAPVASYQGGLLTSQGDARQEAWDLFERRLAIARELGVKTFVVAADIVGPLTQQDLERVQASLQQAADRAGEHDVRIALEFQAQNSFCNNLQTAVSLIDEMGHPQLGLCLDALHFGVGASKLADLALLTKENLFHVQLCDLSGTLREFARDSDRILPGDGDLPLEPIVAQLRAIEYQGAVSVELMNPHIFQVPPLSFGEIAMTALRSVLGMAEAE